MRRGQKPPTLEQRVTAFLTEHNLVSSRKPLLVAVSGGPDSVCLLHVLISLKQELKLKLHVAHLEHGLRGKESVADAQFVLDLCHTLGVPVTIEQRNIRAYQREHKLSLEEAAREVRYGFLAEVAESIGAAWVATGHTRDDHAETILLHIIRGTGTRGLRGLLPVTSLQMDGKSLTLIRPLLNVSREETAIYCHLHILRPRTDSTNQSIALLRNRVRLELLPLLNEYNPGIVEALLRTARIAADDIEVLEKTAGKQLRKVVHRDVDTIIFNKQRLLRLPPGLRRILFRRAIEDILGTLKDIEERHIEEMLALITKSAGRKISLPYGLFYAVEYDRFLLGRELEKTSPYPLLKGEHRLVVPGVTEIPGWCIVADFVAKREAMEKDEFVAFIDYKLVKGELTVRSRHPGDRFQPLGMSEEKKVGQFMIDAYIPRLWRPAVPLVCDTEKVLWVVGYRIDERVKVTEKTRKVLRLRFERKYQKGCRCEES